MISRYEEYFYAAMRAEWFQISREKRTELDSLRLSHHNSVILPAALYS